MRNRLSDLIDMSDWDVFDQGGFWFARICNHGCVRIERADRIPWELAVDATLDFMDRCRTGRLPRGVDEPKELMSICLLAARRQR